MLVIDPKVLTKKAIAITKRCHNSNRERETKKQGLYGVLLHIFKVWHIYRRKQGLEGIDGPKA